MDSKELKLPEGWKVTKQEETENSLGKKLYVEAELDDKNSQGKFTYVVYDYYKEKEDLKKEDNFPDFVLNFLDEKDKLYKLYDKVYDTMNSIFNEYDNEFKRLISELQKRLHTDRES